MTFFVGGMRGDVRDVILREVAEPSLPVLHPPLNKGGPRGIFSPIKNGELNLDHEGPS